MTLAGIEPATFQFVAQRLNHCATAVLYVLCRRENCIAVQTFYVQVFGFIKISMPKYTSQRYGFSHLAIQRN